MQDVIPAHKSDKQKPPLFDNMSNDETDEQLPEYSEHRNEEDGADEQLPEYSEHRSEEDGAGDDLPPPFAPYRPVVKKIWTKRKGILTVSYDRHLSTDGEALYRWLMEESLIPPRPEVRIRGEHSIHVPDGNGKTIITVIDFALELSLETYLLEKNSPDHAPLLKVVQPGQWTYRGGQWRTKASNVETQERRTVRSWADKYCEDQSTLKEFVMKKYCVGWDLALLKSSIRDMIRATNYLGCIKIRFPVLDDCVEVFPPSRISRGRKHDERWPLYLTFLWIFAWPYLWFFTTRYHVAQTVWSYSKQVLTEDGRRQKVYVQSEDEWLRTWGPAIVHSAKARRQGSVSAYGLSRAEVQARLPLNTGNSTINGTPVNWGGDEYR